MASKEDGAVRKHRARKYGQSSPGPYIVIAESEGDNLQISKLAKLVAHDFGRAYVKALPLSRRKTKFLMASAEAANELSTKQYDAVNVPQRLVECLGVAYLEDVDDEDLDFLTSFEKSKCYQTGNPEVIEVRRMQKRGDRGPIPLALAVITFAGNTIPSHVELDNVLYPVRQYNYPVRQCRQCWRFGHVMKQCKSNRRCNSCQSESVDEDHECVGGPVCVNCSGDHRANDSKKCPTINKKREEEKKRQSSFSQGKTDWFAALSPTTEVVDVENTSTQQSLNTSSTQRTVESISATTEEASTSCTTEYARALGANDEEAASMKRKSSEKHYISDDEAYPPLKVRSTVVVDTIVSSDDDQIEEGESSGSLQTSFDAGEGSMGEEFSDLGSPSAIGNIHRFLMTDQSSGGEIDSPNRL